MGSPSKTWGYGGVNTQALTRTVGLDLRALSYATYADYGTEQLVTNQPLAQCFKACKSRLASEVTIKELSRPPPPKNETPLGGPPALCRGEGYKKFLEIWRIK